MSNFISKLKSPFWIGIIGSLISLLIIIIASNILYNRTVTLLTENLRERILTVSITAASSIKAEDLDALQTEGDWQKPEWSSVVNQLHKAKYSNKDIVFMYIFRKKQVDSSQMEFVADADSLDPYANLGEDSTRFVDVNRDGKIEPDGPDKLQFPGQNYPEAVDIPETFEAYKGPLTSKDLYSDAYGTVLTGYAPIKDEYGNTVAVLATDIKADDFFTITRQTLRPFIVFIIFLIFIISILAIVIITTWRKHSKSLEIMNQQIISANERLLVLDKQKSEFVSIASHQLRAPLTSIKGYISLLLEGEYGELDLKTHDVITRIYASTKSLNQIISDFLDVSRIDLGTMKFEKEKFDLKSLIELLLLEMKPAIDISGIHFSFQADIGQYDLIGDENKYKQVLSNLVDNAIKYTKHGSVDIRLVNESDRFEILITDTGVGISPETLPHLFEKFIRAENANESNVIGTGLGLYIARQMLELQGARISAKSKGPGQGTTFLIEIPKK